MRLIMDNQIIKDNLTYVKEKIDQACQKVGRNPDEVSLLLATKTVSPENINKAIDQGETLIGESKAQELQEKYPDIKTDDIETNYISHLQTNKINNVINQIKLKNIINHFSYNHSIKRIKIEKALNKRAKKLGKKLNILIQVNTSYEDSKFGVAPEDTLGLIEQLVELDALNIKGLMTIGRLSADPEEARIYFQRLKAIQEQVKAQNYPGVEMDVLSMGMTKDYEIAVEEGATIVRVGTAIFGERMYPDSYYWNEETKLDD